MNDQKESDLPEVVVSTSLTALTYCVLGSNIGSYLLHVRV